MPSPYADLPKTSFWKTGVADRAAGLSDIHRPKWSFGKSDVVVTMGSCFAQQIAKRLKSLNFNVPHFDETDRVKAATLSANYGNVYTARQARQLFEEALGRFERSEKTWRMDTGHVDCFRPNVFDRPFETEQQVHDSRDVHLKACLKAAAELDVFILTLGLTEAWVVKQCGSVLPVAPGVLAGDFDPRKYEFRNFFFGEIIADIEALVDLIGEIRGGRPFKMLLTVSPVQITATWENRHVLVSSTETKAILRAVAGELSRRLDFVDYFPSYEVVKDPRTVHHNYEENLRTISPPAVDRVMRLFEELYTQGQKPENDQDIRGRGPFRSIDEFGDVDCEEDLLEQFGRDPAQSSSWARKLDSLLFVGNSHLGFLRNALPEHVQREALFAPANFLSNDPFAARGADAMRRFEFRDPRFKDFSADRSEVLILVGMGVFGDAIIRCFGKLGKPYEGCSGSDISPTMPVTLDGAFSMKKAFRRSIKTRLNMLSPAVASNRFRKIIWVVSPDLPVNVARNRLGEAFVESGTYLKIKEIYTEEFRRVSRNLSGKIAFFHHDESLLHPSGFVLEKYASGGKWNVHPHKGFYLDGKIPERIAGCI